MSDLPRPPLPESADAQAALAQQLIDNPLLMTILAELDTDAVNTWRRASNPEQREQAWHLMVAIQALGQRIKGRLDNKRLADSRRR